jgi:hypothetical protein
MFTNQEGPSSTSRPNSRASFRKSTSALNTPEGGRRLGINKRVEEIRARPSASNPVSPSSSSSGPFTPIPSVINPLANRASLHSANKAPANTTTLNKLQASIMKAKIMDPDVVPELKRQYKEALDSHRSNSSATEQTIELVPSLDARGRMYDIGAGAEEDDASSFKPGNKRKKEAKVESLESVAQWTGTDLSFDCFIHVLPLFLFSLQREISRLESCCDSTQMTIKSLWARPDGPTREAPGRRGGPEKLRRRDGVTRHGRCEIQSIVIPSPPSCPPQKQRRRQKLNQPRCCFFFLDGRMTWIIWTIMLIDWPGKKMKTDASKRLFTINGTIFFFLLLEDVHKWMWEWR